MGIRRRTFGQAGLAVVGAMTALVGAGPAFAVAPLPPGGQVNDDLAAGIDRTLGVNGQNPTNADVVGGALTAGNVAVPWAIFRQLEAGGAKDQVFSRSFAAGAWTTRGSGTVGGSSSASPTFSGSLNFDQGQDAQAPAIDFAGASRTVPWATWYENTTGVGFANNNNVFASRFDSTGDANQGKWIFAGQSRGPGAFNSVPVPSLNIHTNQSAENPSVAGGSAADPTKPGPWVTWQETTTLPVNLKNQIFVERSEGPGMTNCTGVTPGGSASPPAGGFCWQQTGVPRVGPGAADPSLNVDPTRNGIEPDIAFTGTNDAMPWVVWYETGPSNTAGLHANELVFAAKAISDGVTANGGFHWVAVGNQLSGTLDATNTCGVSAANEGQCSLNTDPSADAEDPRVAAGTMDPANPSVPWVAWDETVAGHKQVFVSRLNGTGATAQFQLANGGAPISAGTGDSTRPDITFSGNTPHVSWREDVGGGVERTFVGHFVNAANPTFVLDESAVPLTLTAKADVREPISSSCTANPFTADGAACQGGALGTPFFLFTSGTGPLGLFADAYQPSSVVTGAATAGSGSAATISGSVNPAGAPVSAFFQFGTTTAYGQATAAQRLGADNSADTFTAALSALRAGTPIHYRAVAVTDFGTVVGADRTVTITAPPQPRPTTKAGVASARHVRVKGGTVTVAVTCRGGTSCRVSLALTVRETLRGHRIIAVTAAKTAPRRHKLVVVGSSAETVRAGKTAKLTVKLNRAGRRLLAARHRLPAKLTVSQRQGGKLKVMAHRTLTFKQPRRHRGKR